MIIVNTTFVMHPDTVSTMTAWIRNTYENSAVKASADGSRSLLTRVLTPDDEVCTFAMHLLFPDISSAQAWNNGVGARLRAILSERWGEKVLTFCTYLEMID